MSWLISRLSKWGQPVEPEPSQSEAQLRGDALEPDAAKPPCSAAAAHDTAALKQAPLRVSPSTCTRGCHDSVSSTSIERRWSSCSSIDDDPLADHPRYRKLADLNSGSSGFVQLAADMATGGRVAIKFLRRDRRFGARAVGRELLNQRIAQHPHVVQLQEAFLTQHHLAIVMEYADGGNVSQCVDAFKRRGERGMSEGDARWLFQQLLVALDYCHRLGIANRDVKLDNVLLHGAWPRPCVKLCDFGFSVQEGAPFTGNLAGTPEYMAPEVLFEDAHDGRVADVWSCGVSLYVMLTGNFPFKRPGDKLVPRAVAAQRMFGRICSGSYPDIPQASQGVRELLSRMLDPDPGRRATLTDVMASPWFQEALPQSLARLNSNLEQLGTWTGRRCLQSPKELLAVVAAAAAPPA